MSGLDALRVLVVDDEGLARKAILRELRALRPDAVIREARDGFEALDAVRGLLPDLVFLDVEMPELNGFDVLHQIPRPRPKIIFATAYAHFAVQAFEENACDYLVKPFTSERFALALGRALAELGSDAKLSALERSLAAAAGGIERLALRSGNRVDVVPIDEVTCLVSEGHLTTIHAGHREYLSELSLVHFEERLDPAAFVRVHRHALVRQACITRLHERMPASVELNNGMQLPLSRRNRAAVKARLGLG